MATTLPTPDRTAVLKALDAVLDPVSGQGLVAAGLVHGLAVRPGRAGFMLEVPPEEVGRYQAVRAAAEVALSIVPGVTQAQVVLTAEQPKAVASRAAKAAPNAAMKPPHVRQVIAIASGKGGVGKSTVSLGLALGLKSIGLNVGFLDADIYGPSAPVMLGMRRPPTFSPDKQMVPLEAHGLKVNSVGFLVDPGEAMIWRGPMASQALTQLLTQTQWGTEEVPLDVLVVDMPPGTGDVQLTLTQKTLVDGAVVVSTPQEMALADARRAVTLFSKTGIKMLGVVENMAFLKTPDGNEMEVFGRGGARRMAETLKVPFAGEVPLDPALRASLDNGRPLTAEYPHGEMAQRFAAIARAVVANLPPV